MPGISWLHDSNATFAEHEPASPGAAMALLDEGNAAFAGIAPDSPTLVLPVTEADLGFGATPGVAPGQAPFAAVVGCADARVPVEMLFLQSANDLFVVRVAGHQPRVTPRLLLVHACRQARFRPVLGSDFADAAATRPLQHASPATAHRRFVAHPEHDHRVRRSCVAG